MTWYLQKICKLLQEYLEIDFKIFRRWFRCENYTEINRTCVTRCPKVKKINRWHNWSDQAWKVHYGMENNLAWNLLSTNATIKLHIVRPTRTSFITNCMIKLVQISSAIDKLINFRFCRNQYNSTMHIYVYAFVQKQLSRGVLKKRCSENQLCFCKATLLKSHSGMGVLP